MFITDFIITNYNIYLLSQYPLRPPWLWKKFERMIRADLKKQSQFENTQMNVNSVITTNYEQITMNNKTKNKPKQSQFFYTQRGRKEDGNQKSEYLAPQFIAGLPVEWDIGGEQQRLAPQFYWGVATVLANSAVNEVRRKNTDDTGSFVSFL